MRPECAWYRTTTPARGRARGRSPPATGMAPCSNVPPNTAVVDPTSSSTARRSAALVSRSAAPRFGSTGRSLAGRVGSTSHPSQRLKPAIERVFPPDVDVAPEVKLPRCRQAPAHHLIRDIRAIRRLHIPSGSSTDAESTPRGADATLPLGSAVRMRWSTARSSARVRVTRDSSSVSPAAARSRRREPARRLGA